MTVLTIQPDAAAGKDARVWSGGATTNYGAAGELIVGTTTSSGFYRSLLAFDLSSIPPGSTVTSAVLTLTLYDVSSPGDYIVQRVGASWAEATVTWDTQPATDGVTHATTTVAAVGVATWAIAALVQAWVDGTANHGLLLKRSPETTAAPNFTGYSSDYATAADRPKLVVTYNEPSSAPQMIV